MPDGGTGRMSAPWELLEPRTVEMKSVGKIEVREILRRAMYPPSLSAEDRARMAMKEVEKAGRTTGLHCPNPVTSDAAHQERESTERWAWRRPARCPASRSPAQTEPT